MIQVRNFGELYTNRTDLPVIVLHNIDLHWPAEDIQATQAVVEQLCLAMNGIGHPVYPIYIVGHDIADTLQRFDPAEYIVFNWCEEIPHIPRSGALVTQQLEHLGYTYTGADSTALALSQDKCQVKLRLDSCQITTPRWQVCVTAQPSGWDVFPAIVKPAFEHCSFGITHEAVVQTPDELVRRIQFVLDEFHQPALVEDFIDGREFHVTIIGNGKLQMLPPAEMDFSACRKFTDRLCTYDSKFIPDSLDYKTIGLWLPASLTPKEYFDLEQLSISTYHSTVCRDYARLDIRQREGIFYVLDVNPNADISPDTSLAMAAELAGLSYGQLGSLLVNLAAHRHPVFGQEISKQSYGGK